MSYHPDRVLVVEGGLEPPLTPLVEFPFQVSYVSNTVSALT